MWWRLVELEGGTFEFPLTKWRKEKQLDLRPPGAEQLCVFARKNLLV